MAIKQQVHLHEGPGGPFESAFIHDDAAGTQPGVLLFPNFLGIKQWDFDKAEQLAALGYKVLVVDFYGKGKRASGMGDPNAAKYMEELTSDRAKMRDRLLDALKELKGLPGVDKDRCGAIGFCLGGKCVLDLARAGGGIKGGVVFHGVYDAPPFPNAKIGAKLLVCHGWDDPLCPPEATVALGKELEGAGVDWQIHAYGRTGHAFTANEMPLKEDFTFGYQPDTDRRSWKAMTDFLAEALA